MKRHIPLILLILAVAFCLFQLIVTPWGELAGKLVFETNRLPVSSTESATTMIRHHKMNHVIIKGGGFYDYRWSPNGKKIVAFVNEGLALIDEKGNVIQSIAKPREMLGRDIAWFSDGKRVLTIEADLSKGPRQGYEPEQLFLYDFSTGERIPFYVKDDYNFRDIDISETGEIFFTGHPAGKEHLGKGATLYRMHPGTKEMTLLTRGPREIELIDSGRKILFSGSLRLFGQLISPAVLGVYDLKTGWKRYISLWAGDIRQITAVQDGKYLVTAEGRGEAVVLYKRSLLGGFKRPIMKPESLEHLNGFHSQDQYPDWHA